MQKCGKVPNTWQSHICVFLTCVVIATDAHSSRCVGRVNFALCVHALTEKRLELLAANSVDIQCMAVIWHALTLVKRSKVKVTQLSAALCRSI